MGQIRHNHDGSYPLQQIPSSHRVFPLLLGGKDELVSLLTPVEVVEARQALGLGDDIQLVKLQVPGAHSPLYFITSAP